MCKNKDYIIILDNGHGSNTKGKQSPDGKLHEYAYAREIVKGIYESLIKKGYNPYILVPEINDVSLSTRVKRANQIYKTHDKKALLISVHCNASGSDGNWHGANGWSVFLSSNASKYSIQLADCLKEFAKKENLKIRLQYPNKSYWVQSLYICRKSNCPAVLTENLFQDNKSDVDFLLSELGKKSIIDLHVNGIIKYLDQL